MELSQAKLALRETIRNLQPWGHTVLINSSIIDISSLQERNSPTQYEKAEWVSQDYQLSASLVKANSSRLI